MMKRDQTQLGFTLMETVVSISILMLGVLGPMLLAKENLKASRDASDRLVASFLAQEGIEAVRSAIANNSADDAAPSLPNPINWLSGVTSPPGQCDNPSLCIFDLTLVNADESGDLILQACTGPCDPVVYQNTGTYIYRQSAGGPPGAPWTPTKFSRLIEVEVIETDKRLRASTTVSWPRGNITLQEDIYNWFFQLN